MIEALKYIHSKDVIHRDIKPENILDCDGTIKLADFGLSVHAPSQKRKSICGTTDYFPPEMLKSNICYDKKIDIWSIGVLTYEFVVGKPPFDAMSNEETKKRIRKLDYAFPFHLSQLCRHFIKLCLQVDPNRRASIDQLQMHPWLSKRIDKKEV